MISRILFIALEDYISVVSVSEKGKGSPIPFDGETVFKIRDDFWVSWRAQTAYVAPKDDKDVNATICDFCFITDKDYQFIKDEFFDRVVKAKETIWNVEKITDILSSLDILKSYHSISVKMPNGVIFSISGESNEGKNIDAVTNISDMDYKHRLDEKARQDEEKRKLKKKAIAEKKEEKKKFIEKFDNINEKQYSKAIDAQDNKIVKPKMKLRPRCEGEESSIVKYNKKLIAEEKSNR